MRCSAKRRAFRLFVLASLTLTASPSARAQDEPECFSRYTKTNVCEFARKTQAAMAPSLPATDSSSIRIESIVAIGPMLAIDVVWLMTRSELDHLLIANGMPTGGLSGRMEQMATNAACITKELAAFVRLGGQIRWVVKTADNTPIHSPMVTSCPAP